MTAYDAWGKQRARGIVWLAMNAHLVQFRGRDRFVISERSPGPICDPMNTLFAAPAREAEVVDLRRNDVGAARKANGTPPQQRRSGPRWLKVIVRRIDSRRDALVRAHWKKVWRSMVED